MNTPAPDRPIQLNVVNNDGSTAIFELPEATALFAGSGDSCAIPLTGDNVAQFHCMFEFRDNNVIVQDCGTGEPVVVNGSVINNEVNCRIGDSVVIGGCEIIISECCESDLDSDLDTQLAETVLIDDRDTNTQPPKSQQVPSDSISSVIDELNLEVETSADRVDDTWGDLIDEPKRHQSDWLPDKNDDNVQTTTNTLLNEELELLRSELHFLQTELASKDDQIASLTLNPRKQGDESETEKLVERLEELLAELSASDDRVKNLEDLLRFSDEATRAETSEREQIESWLNEIEKRITIRESEWEAETEMLNDELVQTQQQRLNAEAQVKKLLENYDEVTGEKAQSEKHSQLLHQKTVQLQRLLEQSQAEKAAADEMIAQLQAVNEKAADAEQLEQKLVQMELETSRQRAAIARDRAELETRIEEFQRDSQKEPPMDDSDCRFAAMREHLKELHEEEKIAEEERKQNSLSGRISRLLRRT